MSFYEPFETNGFSNIEHVKSDQNIHFDSTVNGNPQNGLNTLAHDFSNGADDLTLVDIQDEPNGKEYNSGLIAPNEQDYSKIDEQHSQNAFESQNISLIYDAEPTTDFIGLGYSEPQQNSHRKQTFCGNLQPEEDLSRFDNVPNQLEDSQINDSNSFEAAEIADHFEPNYSSCCESAKNEFIIDQIDSKIEKMEVRLDDCGKVSEIVPEDDGGRIFYPSNKYCLQNEVNDEPNSRDSDNGYISKSESFQEDITSGALPTVEVFVDEFSISNNSQDLKLVDSSILDNSNITYGHYEDFCGQSENAECLLSTEENQVVNICNEVGADNDPFYKTCTGPVETKDASVDTSFLLPTADNGEEKPIEAESPCNQMEFHVDAEPEQEHLQLEDVLSNASPTAHNDEVEEASSTDLQPNVMESNSQNFASEESGPKVVPDACDNVSHVPEVGASKPHETEEPDDEKTTEDESDEVKEESDSEEKGETSIGDIEVEDEPMTEDGPDRNGSDDAPDDDEPKPNEDGNYPADESADDPDDGGDNEGEGDRRESLMNLTQKEENLGWPLTLNEMKNDDVENKESEKSAESGDDAKPGEDSSEDTVEEPTVESKPEAEEGVVSEDSPVDEETQSSKDSSEELPKGIVSEESPEEEERPKSPTKALPPVAAPLKSKSWKKQPITNKPIFRPWNSRPFPDRHVADQTLMKERKQKRVSKAIGIVPGTRYLNPIKKPTPGVINGPVKMNRRPKAGGIKKDIPLKKPTSPGKVSPTPKNALSPDAKNNEGKKIPPIKAPVGLAPNPNPKAAKSKIGSMQNIKYKPGGGKIKVETKKLEFSEKAKSKVGSTDNMKHKPGGGEKKMMSQKLDWKVQSKIGSLDNAAHKPGGGTKKIESRKLDFKASASSKVGSRDNLKHSPGVSEVKVQ